jgi:hypothetical protein
MSNIIHTRIQKLAQTLDEHQQILASGGAVSLAGLEDEAANICDEIQKMPSAVAREYQESVEMLVSKISAITIMLQEQQSNIAASIDAATKRNFGQRAYVQATHLLPQKQPIE